MEVKIDKSQYDLYVEIYNTQGGVAAKDYVINECGINYDLFQRKMRRCTDYAYNRRLKKYENTTEKGQFMSLEELCGASKQDQKRICNPEYTDTKFDDLMIGLMRDRLIEIQRFIQFEPGMKKVVVNSKRLSEYGYDLTVI
jgi:hypothetical protein